MLSVILLAERLSSLTTTLHVKTFNIYHEVMFNLNKKNPLHQPKDHSLHVGIETIGSELTRMPGFCSKK